MYADGLNSSQAETFSCSSATNPMTAEGAMPAKVSVSERAIVTAALLAIPVIPLYAYGHSAFTLGIGAVLMQFMVQGACHSRASGGTLA